MSRVLLIGTGSVGTVYAMLLSMGEAEITCVCRSNYGVAHVRGFTVRSAVFGERTFYPRVVNSVREAVEDQSPSKYFDFVVVCVKAVNTGITVTDTIRPAVQEAHTSIVVIQNGLGVEEIYRKAFPKNTIISGVTYVPTLQVEPCVVSHAETQKLFLGPYPANLATEVDMRRTITFAQLIQAAQAHAVVCDDVQVERWKKLIGNATWNPICALSRCCDLQFLEATPNLAQEFVLESMREVVAVACALGYGDVIQEEAVQVQLQRSNARQWPGVQPSMLADIENGKTMEVEAVIGEVVRVGRKHQVSVPRLETLYLLLQGYTYQASP
ncbi:ketopantoate reductase PanE/ApbA-domain-containing protein [Boeremia exigua]|uniref:ketopantoate reductase PanE/ApbA-domain-containing protein n=1 Tax=Boeremia exigua TaxID=749465 RepID=UPI001E8DC9FD|nr:ketopantoate reductase PanE/ApbA-domain-containing protein [Boeremia exigua]KAH6619053.1 ketopantoate reductase PanE/ApbA-domain-containing protein [Boeremia exigua]